MDENCGQNSSTNYIAILISNSFIFFSVYAKPFNHRSNLSPSTVSDTSLLSTVQSSVCPVVPFPTLLFLVRFPLCLRVVEGIRSILSTTMPFLVSCHQPKPHTHSRMDWVPTLDSHRWAFYIASVGLYRHFLEKEKATHPSIPAWRILWKEEPGGLLSIGSHRVRHDWSDLACMHASEKEMAIHSSIVWRIPGTEEPGGLLFMGSHRVGHGWSDLATAATSTFSVCLCVSLCVCVHAHTCEFLPYWTLRANN